MSNTTHPNHAPALRQVQSCLRRLSYTDASIPPPPIDGISGSVTEAAIAAFQESYHLPVTGSVDAATWEALRTACAENAALTAPSLPIFLFPRTPIGYTVAAGDEGALVAVIQLLLRETLLGFGQDAADLTVSGLFDPATETAVLAFQRIHRLPETGRVNTATWNRLAEEQNNRYRELPGV